MFNKVPGTLLDVSPDTARDPYSAIEPLLAATGGLTLSQVSEMTGIEPTTIQNWVKRGWVASPRHKRYGETQLMRIILINMLRGTLHLDSIAKLMTYINGSALDTSDDIIPDAELYSRLCGVIKETRSRTPRLLELDAIVTKELAGYEGQNGEETPSKNREKLQKALVVMALSYEAAQISELAAQKLNEINFSNNFKGGTENGKLQRRKNSIGKRQSLK